MNTPTGTSNVCREVPLCWRCARGTTHTQSRKFAERRLGQGLRHADENGGTGTRRQRSQDFLQKVTHIKNWKLSGFGPLFLWKWGIIPRTLKNGGTRPPVPPVAEPWARASYRHYWQRKKAIKQHPPTSYIFCHDVPVVRVRLVPPDRGLWCHQTDENLTITNAKCHNAKCRYKCEIVTREVLCCVSPSHTNRLWTFHQCVSSVTAGVRRQEREL